MKLWLSLGGNVGDVQRAMSGALQALDAESGTSVTAVSSIYRTPPWGPVEQDWFLNCCAEVETDSEPLTFLAICQEQERRHDRQRDVRWGPRTLDIDIVALNGNVALDLPGLQVPHPRAHERPFVTVPLSEIASDVMLGGSKVSDLAADEKLEALDLPDDWWRAA